VPTADVTAGAVSVSAARPPRLRLEPTGSHRTLLDGGWWPRSVDPAAELPGLVLAIDKLRGPVTRLVLNAEAWDPHPRRLEVAGRIRRMGYFTSQPTALLTARCDNGQRVDLLAAADAASTLETDDLAEQTWDSEGGKLARPSSAAHTAPR
jgi:hypothetical protein